MRILWVSKSSNDANAGDEIFDRRMIAACTAAGHQVSLFRPTRVKRPAEALNVLRGLPHYRTWYDSAENYAGLADRARGVDVTICSWEPFDALAYGMKSPVIPVLHNITSTAFASMFPGSLPARWVSRRAGKWERRTYSDAKRFPTIAVLARPDEDYVRRVAPKANVIWTPPGLPPLAALSADARFVPELLISGTYGWFPKRRDVLKFADEYAAAGLTDPVVADDLPPAAAAILRPRPSAESSATSSAIRLGIIPDRFSAGHKLKASYYVANNAVVLSFADISPEFAGIADHAFFVRHIRHAADIARISAELVAIDPGALRVRFDAFKAACAEQFSWQTSAARLLGAAEALVGQSSGRAMAMTA